MTKEQAIKELTELLPEEFLSEYAEAIRMAIKALEQEPCGDTVSRSAVIDTLTKTSGIRGDALKALYDLPPVTPQSKMGRWIDDKCSVCGKGTEDLISSSEWYENEEPNFCPFCGIKMEVK